MARRRARLTTSIVDDDEVNDGASTEPAGPLVIARIPGNRRYYRYDLSRNTNTDEMLSEMRAGRQLEVHEGNRRGPDITRETLLVILCMRERAGERLAMRQELETILLRGDPP